MSCLAERGMPFGMSAAAVRLPVLRPITTSTLLPKGHSKWQNIKDTKAKNDDTRSRRIASYLNKMRQVVREGFDPKLNKKLADLEKDYNKESLPMDTFNKCLQRLKDRPDVIVPYQLVGPGGSLFIVKVEAESKTRTQGVIAKIIKKVPDLKLTDTLMGIKFEEKGIIIVNSQTKSNLLISLEKVEEVGIELECEEVSSAGNDESGEKFELICDPINLDKIERKLDELDFDVLSAETQMLTIGDRVKLNDADAAIVEKFYKVIEELESVSQVFDNLEQEEESDTAVTATN